MVKRPNGTEKATLKKKKSVSMCSAKDLCTKNGRKKTKRQVKVISNEKGLEFNTIKEEVTVLKNQIMTVTLLIQKNQ